MTQWRWMACENGIDRKQRRGGRVTFWGSLYDQRIGLGEQALAPACQLMSVAKRRGRAGGHWAAFPSFERPSRGVTLWVRREEGRENAAKCGSAAGWAVGMLGGV